MGRQPRRDPIFAARYPHCFRAQLYAPALPDLYTHHFPPQRELRADSNRYIGASGLKMLASFPFLGRTPALLPPSAFSAW